MNSPNKQIRTLILFVILILNSIFCKFLENNIASFAEVNEIATIKEDNESAFLQAVDKLNKNGGIIYIDTPVINISIKSPIRLTSSQEGGIVGVQQSNGEYPRLDFKNARNANANNYGIKIQGSNQFIKYLIIENSSHQGIFINGNKNTIDHVITRYNCDSGIQISEGAQFNTINYCYSYRNCDVVNYGKNADGFAPKLNAKNTVFNYCFSWENSDDGWDSFDKEGQNTDSVTYSHCASWNNGNSDVFIGKYDYNNGKELDKNMLTIQHLINSDNNFESNYKNKKFNIDNGKINGVKASEWITQANKNMNGNGFKLGSNITPKSPDVKRTADYCVTFDHKNKGFDNNNSEKCTGSFTNCASFNNNINYKLPYTFTKWSNNWSWGAKKSDIEDTDKTVQKPTNIDSVIKDFYKIRDQIIASVYANKFPDNINFDKAIKSLS